MIWLQPRHLPSGDGSSVWIDVRMNFHPLLMFSMGPYILKSSTYTMSNNFSLLCQYMLFQSGTGANPPAIIFPHNGIPSILRRLGARKVTILTTQLDCGIYQPIRLAIYPLEFWPMFRCLQGEIVHMLVRRRTVKKCVRQSNRMHQLLWMPQALPEMEITLKIRSVIVLVFDITSTEYESAFPLFCGIVFFEIPSFRMPKKSPKWIFVVISRLCGDVTLFSNCGQIPNNLFGQFVPFVIHGFLGCRRVKHLFSFYGSNDHGAEYIHASGNSSSVSVHVILYDKQRWNLYDSQFAFAPVEYATFPSFVNQPDHWVGVVLCHLSVFSCYWSVNRMNNLVQGTICLGTWLEYRVAMVQGFKIGIPSSSAKPREHRLMWTLFNFKSCMYCLTCLVRQYSQPIGHSMAMRPPCLRHSFATILNEVHLLLNKLLCSFIFSSPPGFFAWIFCQGEPPVHGIDAHNTQLSDLPALIALCNPWLVITSSPDVSLVNNHLVGIYFDQSWSSPRKRTQLCFFWCM